MSKNFNPKNLYFSLILWIRKITFEFLFTDQEISRLVDLTIQGIQDRKGYNFNNREDAHIVSMIPHPTYTNYVLVTFGRRREDGSLLPLDPKHPDCWSRQATIPTMGLSGQDLIDYINLHESSYI